MTTEITAKIILDSMNPKGCRLTTFELTYPRFIHAEIMTHRMFSRNSASSRAIPISKMHERIADDPVVPQYWGKNQSGMQAYEELDPKDKIRATNVWLEARDHALRCAKRLNELGLHKQIVNRITEPFMWITVLLSTTSFKHFERLRNHHAAEPHFQELARKMVDARIESTPQELKEGDWHLPLTFSKDRDFEIEDLVKLSAARCARVSYLTHDGVRDPEKDLELHDRLVGPGHWSPFEHVARSEDHDEWLGNFQGFTQYRKMFHDEFVGDNT